MTAYGRRRSFPEVDSKARYPIRNLEGHSAYRSCRSGPFAASERKTRHLSHEIWFTGTNDDETYPKTYLEHCLGCRIDHGVDSLFNFLDETHCELLGGFIVVERKVVWDGFAQKKIISNF